MHGWPHWIILINTDHNYELPSISINFLPILPHPNQFHTWRYHYAFTQQSPQRWFLWPPSAWLPLARPMPSSAGTASGTGWRCTAQPAHRLCAAWRSACGAAVQGGGALSSATAEVHGRGCPLVSVACGVASAVVPLLLLLRAYNYYM